MLQKCKRAHVLTSFCRRWHGQAPGHPVDSCQRAECHRLSVLRRRPVTDSNLRTFVFKFKHTREMTQFPGVDQYLYSLHVRVVHATHRNTDACRRKKMRRAMHGVISSSLFSPNEPRLSLRQKKLASLHAK